MGTRWSFTRSPALPGIIDLFIKADAANAQATYAALAEFGVPLQSISDTVQSYNAARADYARSLYVIDAVMAAPR